MRKGKMGDVMIKQNILYYQDISEIIVHNFWNRTKLDLKDLKKRVRMLPILAFFINLSKLLMNLNFIYDYQTHLCIA